MIVDERRGGTGVEAFHLVLVLVLIHGRTTDGLCTVETTGLLSTIDAATTTTRQFDRPRARAKENGR